MRDSDSHDRLGGLGGRASNGVALMKHLRALPDATVVLRLLRVFGLRRGFADW